MLAVTLVLAITNVTVIDGTGAPPKPAQTVVIRDGRIAAIGDALAVPPGAQTIDGTGRFLIPGLWDMHVHVLTHAEEQFPKLLAAGITGIRNMHVEGPDPLPTAVRWRKAVERDPSVIGPHIVANGPIVDGPKPMWSASLRAEDARSAREAVLSLKQGGADFIKTYDFLPRDAYFALMKEAQRLHLPVAGHVPLWVSAEEAARAGQHGIDHLSGVFPACTSDGTIDNALKRATNLWMISTQYSAKQLQSIVSSAASTYDASFCHPLYQLFVEKNVWHCPTLVALQQLQPAGLIAVRQMHQTGVRLLAGTDAGGPGIEPGESLHRELELLVAAGLSPLEALQTATSNPAEFLGRSKDLGTITKGKIADLVLLEANPLEDIRNLRKVRKVILRGQPTQW